MFLLNSLIERLQCNSLFLCFFAPVYHALVKTTCTRLLCNQEIAAVESTEVATELQYSVFFNMCHLKVKMIANVILDTKENI